MRIYKKKLFIDLKYFSSECHRLALNCEKIVDEFWKNDIFSDHGLSACKSYLLPPTKQIVNLNKISGFISVINTIHVRPQTSTPHLTFCGQYFLDIQDHESYAFNCVAEGVGEHLE